MLRFGGIDVVINNAGIGARRRRRQRTMMRSGISVLDINVVGMVRVSRAALPYLRELVARGDRQHRLGRRLDGLAGPRVVLRRSKGAVLALTLAMAADHVHEGIRVNCVNPGTADTPWVGRMLDEARRSGRRTQPHSKRGSRSDAWLPPTKSRRAIAYLASPAAASTTGTALAVDGGMYGLRLPPRPAT